MFRLGHVCLHPCIKCIVFCFLLSVAMTWATGNYGRSCSTSLRWPTRAPTFHRMWVHLQICLYTCLHTCVYTCLCTFLLSPFILLSILQLSNLCSSFYFAFGFCVHSWCDNLLSKRLLRNPWTFWRNPSFMFVCVAPLSRMISFDWVLNTLPGLPGLFFSQIGGHKVNTKPIKIKT